MERKYRKEHQKYTVHGPEVMYNWHVRWMKRENMMEAICEKIIVENFPKPKKNINSQIQCLMNNPRQKYRLQERIKNILRKVHLREDKNDYIEQQ